MIPCTWKQNFGLECPSCGIQRSSEALIQGDLLQSLVLFPALIPFVLLILFTILHVFRPKRFPVQWVLWSMYVTVGLMVGNWLYKII